MPTPVPATAIDPQQALAAAQANLISSAASPSLLTGDPATDPSQQQISDVESSPVHPSLAAAYQHVLRHQQARSRMAPTGGYNRGTSVTPLSQHVAGAGMPAQSGGSMYINQGFGQLDQGGGGYDQAQDMAEHPTEDFGTIQQTPAEAAKADLEKTKEHDKMMAESQKSAEAYQDSLQGVGHFAPKTSPATTAKFLVNEDDKQLKAANKTSILGGGVADPSKVEALEADRDSQIQRLGGKATAGVNATHTLKGRPIALQNNAWVYTDTGEPAQ